jgi:hypothetical protein
MLAAMSALPPEWQAFFAVAAFVLSVILATIKVYEASLDRMRVKVKAHTLAFCSEPQGQDFSQPRDYAGLKVEIVNRGRRVAYVISIGIPLKPEKHEATGLQSLGGFLNFNIGAESLQLLEWQRKAFNFTVPPDALDQLQTPTRVYVTLSNGKTIKAPFRAFSKAVWDDHLTKQRELRRRPPPAA